MQLTRSNRACTFHAPVKVMASSQQTSASVFQRQASLIHALTTQQAEFASTPSSEAWYHKTHTEIGLKFCPDATTLNCCVGSKRPISPNLCSCNCCSQVSLMLPVSYQHYFTHNLNWSTVLLASSRWSGAVQQNAAGATPYLAYATVLAATSAACRKSATRSAGASMPTATRTRPSGMPSAARTSADCARQQHTH
jgi:hypothetical protein